MTLIENAEIEEQPMVDIEKEICLSICESLDVDPYKMVFHPKDEIVVQQWEVWLPTARKLLQDFWISP